MTLRRIDPYLAADAMAVHRVTLDHACWLLLMPDGGLKGCAIGALFYATFEDVPFDQTDVIAWAVEHTRSRPYVQGFDVGFHGFTPEEKPTTHDYVLGLDDGRATRLIVEHQDACRPALCCWRGSKEAE